MAPVLGNFGESGGGILCRLRMRLSQNFLLQGYSPTGDPLWKPIGVRGEVLLLMAWQDQIAQGVDWSASGALLHFGDLCDRQGFFLMGTMLFRPPSHGDVGPFNRSGSEENTRLQVFCCGRFHPRAWIDAFSSLWEGLNLYVVCLLGTWCTGS